LIVQTSAFIGNRVREMKSDQSVPLSEALQHFSDSSDWEELRSLQSYRVRFFVLGAPEREYERRHRRYHQLKERLEAGLVAKLTAASLQATGFEGLVGLDDERRLIRAEWWEKLKPDFAASEAKGPGGLHVVDIRVQESQPARTGSARPGPAGEYASGGHVSLTKLRADVRRWLQREARRRGTSWQKKHYCGAARTRFGDRVTDNLFNEVWRSADLPEALRRPGLRKANKSSSGSSPPV
jgi:hypothetical protein